MNNNYILSAFVAAVLLLFLVPGVFGQTITQTIKGNVFDIQTRETLIGASVVILDTHPLIGASTDIDGNFTLRRAPLGRHSIQVNYIGYEPVILPEVLVTSGREVVLNIGLRQSISEMDEVIVTPEILKAKPLNAMATVSSRSFSVEETRRYGHPVQQPDAGQFRFSHQCLSGRVWQCPGRGI